MKASVEQMERDAVVYLTPLALSIGGKAARSTGKVRSEVVSEALLGALLAFRSYDAHRSESLWRYAGPQIRRTIVDEDRHDRGREGSNRRQSAGELPVGLFGAGDEDDESDAGWLRLVPHTEPGYAEVEERLAPAERANEILSGLPEQYREVLESVYLRGELKQDVAARMGMCPSQMSGVHKRALSAARLVAA